MKMRTLAHSLRQVRYLSQIRAGIILHYGLGRTEGASVLVDQVNYFSSRAFQCREISSIFKNQSVMFLKPLSTSVANEPSRATHTGGAGPSFEYERKIAVGELYGGDNFQVHTIQKLQRLYEELVEHKKYCKLDRSKPCMKLRRTKWPWSHVIAKSSYSPVKGLYLYGGVGTGKTMLMDLFFDQLPSNWRKRRIHFHDFMLNLHSRLQIHKGVADPLEVVAAEISDESILLCLDEFMVTDVAEAFILNTLFHHLFSNGIILVCTSNCAPDQLYKRDLKSDLCIPFAEIIKERCVVHVIVSEKDYRQMGSAETGFYFVGKKYSLPLKRKFHQLIGAEEPIPQVVEVIMERELEVPLGANGCAYFPFEDLCERPLGAADYFGLFKKFHTLALEGIPKFGLYNRTAAYRFGTLIDVMYEKKARLLCTAEASPVELFERIVTLADAQKISAKTSEIDEIDLCVDNRLGFTKYRTISRLTEMNSKDYLKQHKASIQD